jgi:hypothetical protein
MYQIFDENKMQDNFLIYRPFLAMLYELYFLEAKPFFGEVASGPLLSALSSQK